MLIVLEGVDSSGKATQAARVYEFLKKEGKNVMKITFPDYESQSSALVKMYLNGEFGGSAADVSPYAASAFYAVDRYASYSVKWGEFLKAGGTVIADRYVTSNMIHQAAKIENMDEKNRFLDWVYDFEYEKLGLPVPNHVIFLDMPPKFAAKLMGGRKNKMDGGDVLDIHEKDVEYLENAYKNAVYVAEKYGWQRVRCAEGDIRQIDDITREIIKIINL